MAAPAINVTQSVLGFRQWEPWVFQPYATNNPTFWNCTPLPGGVTFDPDTGEVAGPATVPGVYNFALRAGNTDGVSEPVVFALGIEATGFTEPSMAIEMVVDVPTKRVALSTGAAISFGEGTALRPDPILFVKAGDDLILAVRLVKNGIGIGVTLTEMKLVLKELEPETVLCTSDEWEQVGEGVDRVYHVHLKVDGDELRAALSNYEEDDGTQFPALAEIQWTQSNPGGFGPDMLVSTSRTFTVMIPRDLVENS